LGQVRNTFLKKGTVPFNFAILVKNYVRIPLLKIFYAMSGAKIFEVLKNQFLEFELL